MTRHSGRPPPAGQSPEEVSVFTSRSEPSRQRTMKYADAGVNIAVADDAKQRIRHLASRTFTPAVLGGIGGLGALFSLDHKKLKKPVLVFPPDGVGTKLKKPMALGVDLTPRRRPLH